MTLSGRGKVQRHLHNTGGTRYRAARATVPDGWPEEIQCPGCGEVQPTVAYQMLGRKASHTPLLNIVLACLRPGCKNVFSPRPEYFARAEDAPYEGTT
jgi:hypothetical protein